MHACMHAIHPLFWTLRPHHARPQLFRALSGMDSNNYPETAQAIWVVNAATAFTAVWRILRVFVDEGTRDKVRVMGGGDPMLVGGRGWGWGFAGAGLLLGRGGAQQGGRAVAQAGRAAGRRRC